MRNSLIEQLYDFGSVIWEHTRKTGRTITIKAEPDVIEAIKKEFEIILSNSETLRQHMDKIPENNFYTVQIGGNYFHFEEDN